MAWFALAAALGAGSRYGLAGLVQRSAGQGAAGAFPWGTLAVNVSGCFLFGLLWAATFDRLSVRQEVQFIVLTGFVGSFTTFSTFAFETGQMLRDGQWGFAAAYVLAQNLLGIAAVLVGFVMGRLLGATAT